MNTSNLLLMVGKNIRQKRLSRNMSIEEVATLMEITPGYLGLMERGQRGISAKNIYKLSVIFNEPIDSFFVQKEEEGKGESPIDVLKNKIFSTFYDMNEKELTFILEVIDSLKDMRD